MTWLYFAIIASVVWGLSYTISSEILFHISTITLLTLQMFFSVLIFCLSLFFNNYRKEILIIFHDKQLLLLVIIQIVVCLSASYLSWQSLKIYSNPGVIALVESTYPLFAIIFSYVFFKVFKLNVFSILGSLLIFAGVIIIKINSV